jgi:riboflavin kinase/FMN adenylyltransferase
MKVYTSLDSFPTLPFAVVTTGTFDGVHLGHQRILGRMQEICQRHQGQSVVVTYHPHPRIALGKAEGLQVLSTLEEKQALLKQFGVDCLLILPFTREFSALSSEDFIQQVLRQSLRTRKLVIGYDHRFGKNREGSFEYLSKHAFQYGFEVEEIPAQEVDDITVSSTRIRNALMDGRVSLANEFLGHAYSLTGRVVKGRQLGRTIGYPTANLEVEDPYKLIPADGVYAVRVQLEETFLGGMLSIGNNPTVNGTHTTIEVNLFDFDQDLYGRYLTLYFQQYMRAQETYEGLGQLKLQLKEDESQARRLLAG